MSEPTPATKPATPAKPGDAKKTADKKDEPDEIVTLSPFILSSERDGGWSANDTLSATRTKQALKDVPVNIDAITVDFIEDLGLFTTDEVANYVANAFAPPTMENDNQSGAITFRGLSGSTATRNYFRWYVPSDTYNVERIDFGKGSNSLIFGDVEPGGQASVFTFFAYGARASPWSASWAAQYSFSRDSHKLLRGASLGINGSWRDDYLLGINSGQELVGGATHLMHAYVARTQRIWKQMVTIRAEVKNITDLENGKVRKTGFTTLSTGQNVYRYSYVVPTEFNVSDRVRF